MKVSVIIPACNEAAYIQDTLQTVCAQEFPDFEVIVVDNASTDRTADLARAFPVRVVYEPQKGILFARERGRQEARGEIIAQLDADCRPPQGWLAKGAAVFADPQVVAVSGFYDFYDASLLFRCASYLMQGVVFRLAHVIVPQLSHRGTHMVGGNAFVRASALEKIGGYNTAIRFHGEDTDTACRLKETGGKILYRRSILVQSSARRFHAEGAVATMACYFINYWWVLVFKRPFSV
jgi:glycosyltransferase involved in cell wall biosynthesis